MNVSALPKLTEAQRRALTMIPPFRGPQPGSNFWSYLEFELEAGTIDGEEVNFLITEGLISGEPVSGEIETLPEANCPFGLPDIELTHQYDITPAGRKLLSEAET